MYSKNKKMVLMKNNMKNLILNRFLWIQCFAMFPTNFHSILNTYDVEKKNVSLDSNQVMKNFEKKENKNNCESQSIERKYVRVRFKEIKNLRQVIHKIIKCQIEWLPAEFNTNH